MPPPKQNPEPPKNPRCAMDHRERVCRAMNFISRNLDRDPTLDEIARSAAFSMFHFHRIFKTVAGETVAGFTRRLRLETAANRLLSRGRDDITTIAMDCGFSSSQNFARAFRQHFGTTPSAFRERKNGTTHRKQGNDLLLPAGHTPPNACTDSAGTTRSNNMKAEVKEMPEFHVAYVRKLGPYGPETCGAAFGELMQWAGPRGFASDGVTLGVYWDNPEVTPPDRCRVDACVTVPGDTRPEAPVALQTITGGPHAVCHFEITGDSFQQAWDDAFAWLIANGHDPDDRPCYERYHQHAAEHPEGKFCFDICIPLKR